MARRPILSATLAACLVCGAVRVLWGLSEAFSHPAPPHLRRVVSSWRRSAETDADVTVDAEARKHWQKHLDVALFDIDASLEERFAGLKQLLLSPGDVVASLREAALAVVAEGPTAEGAARALDAVLPRGTTARADLEGLLAIARQAPEVLGEVFAKGPVAPWDVNASDVAPSLDEVRQALQDLLSPEGLANVAHTAVDGLRSTPKGFQEPSYEVFAGAEDYEVRRYRDFATATPANVVPRAKLGWLSTSDPFSAVAVQLASASGTSMTMPMQVEYAAESLEPLAVSFVLPQGERGVAGMAAEDVDIAEFPEKLLAVRRFHGIATAAEAKRQYELLVAALSPDNIFEPLRQGEFSVLQYNPPYTVPWRRRNEIAVEVQYNAFNAERIERERAAAAAATHARQEAEEIAEGMVDVEIMGD